jgi:hypothetical protein
MQPDPEALLVLWYCRASGSLISLASLVASRCATSPVIILVSIQAASLHTIRRELSDPCRRLQADKFSEDEHILSTAWHAWIGGQEASLMQRKPHLSARAEWI